MRVERWALGAATALALALVPGLARMAPTAPPVDRVVAVPGGQRAASGDVAITAPAAFTGAPAAATGPTPSLAAAAETGGVYAVIVGIDDYPGRGYDLGAAGNDAALIDEALDGFGVPDDHRVLLRDGQATRPAIEAAIAQLVSSGDAESTLVFAFAGHARKLDRDTEELVAADGGSITDERLAALLAPAGSRSMWVLLANCYAGGFTEVVAPGRILTGAAPAGRIAYENAALGASYLVHHLVQQGWLEGRAGPSVQEAYAYAEASIVRTRPDRRPIQIDQADGPLVLGPGDPKVERPVAPRPEPLVTSRPPPRPPTTTTTTVPPTPPATTPTKVRQCTLVVLCDG